MFGVVLLSLGLLWRVSGDAAFAAACIFAAALVCSPLIPAQGPARSHICGATGLRSPDTSLQGGWVF